MFLSEVTWLRTDGALVNLESETGHSCRLLSQDKTKRSADVRYETLLEAGQITFSLEVLKQG